MKVPHALYSLAASLKAASAAGPLTAEVNAGRVMFLGGRYGAHSVDASSSPERVLAHWAGYVAANNDPCPPTNADEAARERAAFHDACVASTGG
jgi:hypothetical protein